MNLRDPIHFRLTQSFRGKITIPLACEGNSLGGYPARACDYDYEEVAQAVTRAGYCCRVYVVTVDNGDD